MSEETDTLEDRIDRLEAVIEEQQETIERQTERIEELDSEDSTTAEEDGITVSRRGALAAGGVLGLLGLGAGTAGANPTGSVGTPSSPLETLYTAELDGPLTSSMVNTLAGDGLEIANNALQVNVGDSLSTGDDGSLNAECEWVQDTYEIIPADPLVHTVDLDGRMIDDRESEREIYHPNDGLQTAALDTPWVVIAGNQVSLGGSTNIQHNRLLNLAYDNHHGPGDGLAWNPDTVNYDIAPADFAGHGLGVDAENNLEVTSSGSAAWSEGTDTLEPANPGNYSSIDMKANDVIDSSTGTTIYNSTDSYVPASTIQSGSIGIEQLDTSISPTWLSAHTWDTSAGPALTLDDTGLSYSTANAETLNVSNSGTGSVTLAEDGVGVVNENRSILAGNALTGGGDLSADRTVGVASNSIGYSELADLGQIDWNRGGTTVPQATAGPIANGNINRDGTGNTVGVKDITNNNPVYSIQFNFGINNASNVVTMVQPLSDFAESRLTYDTSGDLGVVDIEFEIGLERGGFQFVTYALPGF